MASIIWSLDGAHACLLADCMSHDVVQGCLFSHCAGQRRHSSDSCCTDQVLVNELRVRVRLDEGRLRELLQSERDAATTAGLLACLGDLATISFQPHLSGAPHSILPPAPQRWVLTP
jgi:hypothetical protein